MFQLSRRDFLVSAGAFTILDNVPYPAFAGTRDPRLVVVILRGALDGLAAVPPVGDTAYSAVRDDLAMEAENALPLDGFFGLNPAMPKLHARFRIGEALILHAVATPYRGRSHYEGQAALESGMSGICDTGWLNRAAAALPAAGIVQPRRLFAVGASAPLIVRGLAPTLVCAPAGLRFAGSERLHRLVNPLGVEEVQVAATGFGAGRRMETGDPASSYEEVAAATADLLADAEGVRIAAIGFDGWDTHTNQSGQDGRLARLLSALDTSLAALAKGLVPVWKDTVVVVVSEFGRTVRPNDMKGTDHGTATAAFVLGGAVKGGRVMADWPGLESARLHDRRDLAPTTDLRAVFKGILRDHFGFSDKNLATTVFPDTPSIRPIDGLFGSGSR